MSSSVAVIDYGMGNLHSVAKALEHVAPNARVTVTNNPTEIRAADRVVFPGVGAMRDCMAGIRQVGADVLVKEAIAQKPVLAICVGMQALMTHSEENSGVDCLNILQGAVRFFGSDLRDRDGQRLKVPHMGWNEVQQIKSHAVWSNIPQNSRFYFVHSYYVSAQDRSLVAAGGDYGVAFDAALLTKNLFAVQFHPEKSHTAGLQLLKNFMFWDGCC
ncbi:MAG TPA: imidazole glycerol phosphate synthase subunit HisH [Pseudomonadales bacterium]|jgi:glutamine amidotransferase|nr:imidazole glycerol phosphate synthase subunit HisH [Pseudomonadales bacterium]HNN86084.1 imidazole glycerol phosphate synthase subunit HisH [Pseudomonadales bacterium]